MDEKSVEQRRRKNEYEKEQLESESKYKEYIYKNLFKLFGTNFGVCLCLCAALLSERNDCLDGWIRLNHEDKR